MLAFFRYDDDDDGEAMMIREDSLSKVMEEPESM